jgi:hypothetical protein
MMQSPNFVASAAAELARLNTPSYPISRNARRRQARSEREPHPTETDYLNAVQAAFIQAQFETLTAQTPVIESTPSQPQSPARRERALQEFERVQQTGIDGLELEGEVVFSRGRRQVRQFHNRLTGRPYPWTLIW